MSYSYEPEPSPPHVLDPTLGSDGGGRYGGDELGPYEHPGGVPEQALRDPVQPDVAVCPTCGTAVARDRLRG